MRTRKSRDPLSCRMTLINPALLFGLVLATVPVILHMVMRAKPKRIEFPALRLLKARRPSNSRRMQLRHFLLLLLRALLIAALVLAIARPSLPAARYGLRWWEWTILGSVVVASVAVYRYLTRTRLTQSANSYDAIAGRARFRLWCTMGGLLAAFIGVGVPWGLRVRAELLAPRSEAAEDIPVAAVFIVDTSISMNYRFENRTRLQQAAAIAVEHLGRFPAGSRVAVAGLDGDEDIVFQADLSGAASRLESLESTPVPESLNRRVKAAIQTQVDDRKRLQEENGSGGMADSFAREIYVLTDLARTAWTDPDEGGLADAIKSADWLQTYVVDVSVQAPQNLSLTALELSDETTVAGRDLLMTMSVNRTGNAAMMTTVETVVLDQAGTETRQGAPQVVKLETGAAQVRTSVKVTGTEGFLEGLIRITSEDPLADDNVRYFCCGIRPRPKVLLISDLPDESDYIRNALQPARLEKIGVQICECTSIVTAVAGQESLSDYDVVFLVNCQRPDESLWTSLRNFVASGGGVFVVAGSERLQVSAWNSTAASELLPGSLIPAGSRGPVKFLREPSQLQLSGATHPLLRSFQNDQDARVELTACAFDKC
ncbi:MAG: BatA domain-containing protein, partial [Planctomycetota bacterium]